MVEVNCETDFVAKNDDFLAFAAALARLVAEQAPADVAALSALTLDGKPVEQVRTALVGKIGENMSIRRFERVESNRQDRQLPSRRRPDRRAGRPRPAATKRWPRIWRCTSPPTSRWR